MSPSLDDRPASGSSDLPWRPSASRLLGSARRTQILLLVALLEETYASELARLLEVTPFQVRRIVDDLESEGVLAARTRGRMRFVRLDPRFFAAKEFKALLKKLAQANPELLETAEKRRSRPRRRGKPI